MSLWLVLASLASSQPKLLWLSTRTPYPSEYPVAFTYMLLGARSALFISHGTCLACAASW